MLLRRPESRPQRRGHENEGRNGIIKVIALTITIWIVALFWATNGIAHGGVPVTVDRALHQASARYGVSYWQMRSVSFCESRWRPWAVGYGSHGLFQFLRSTWAHTPYASRNIYDPFANALAAAWLVRQDGGWQEWSCRP